MSRTQMACRHNYVPDPTSHTNWIWPSRVRKLERHAKRCAGEVFAHAGVLGKVVCCLGCGKRVL